MTFSNNTCCCVWLMRLESYLLSTWRWLFAYTYANCGKPLRAHLHFAMNVFNCILCGCGFFINIQHLIIIIIILLKYFIYFLYWHYGERIYNDSIQWNPLAAAAQGHRIDSECKRFARRFTQFVYKTLVELTIFAKSWQIQFSFRNGR